MRHAAISGDNSSHQSNAMVRLFFGNDYNLTSKVKSLFGSILCMAQKFWHDVNSSLAKIKSPLDRLFGEKVNNIDTLQK